jgi:hypothetical protein
MPDQQNGNTKENDNVIQGPWPKSKRKVKLPDDEAIELQENIEFAEELTQTLIIQMIQTMGENNISVSSESFIRDLGLIIELIKGSIYRSMGIPHPTHGFFEVLVDVDIDEDDVIHSNIDLNLLGKFIETSKNYEDNNDDDPKVS